MKLPANAIIARRKIDEYLLHRREEDDKSGFLALAGYTLENADRLMSDLRAQLLPLDAQLFDETEYGTKYRIRGTLTGPNGRVLRVLRVDHLDERSRDRPDEICYVAAGQAMKYDLFIRVALAQDLPQRRLRRGDVATVVEHHAGRPGEEPGYSLEVFNAVGEGVDVVTVRESQIEPLTADELLTVRSLEPAAP